MPSERVSRTRSGAEGTQQVAKQRFNCGLINIDIGRARLLREREAIGTRPGAMTAPTLAFYRAVYPPTTAERDRG